MANPILLFRIDVGFDPDRGYAAVITDVLGERQKGIKGNSIRNLMRNVNQQVCETEQVHRRFPLEHERSRIITPNGT
jgi:hypothetical protein